MILSDTLLNYLTIGLIIFLGLFVALWISLIIWAYRDMRSRSRDLFAQVLTILVVTLLPVIGILIYLILRPAETLSEAFERSLLEESLLQEIEKKSHCPGCSRHVQSRWQACPYCHVRLKQACVNCQELVEMQWTICPYCTAEQPPMVPPLAPANEVDAYDSTYLPSEPVDGILEYEEDDPTSWTISD